MTMTWLGPMRYDETRPKVAARYSKSRIGLPGRKKRLKRYSGRLRFRPGGIAVSASFLNRQRIFGLVRQ